ncbi:STAS domain-containing protein [Amycolatopsis cihanbeyliensis]|uniref:Anti-sigma factor antagonist n=1 Tax=Amycolatopsis cihanbeyliensis TaxID=1128664 RepID=A0A542CUC1_AMYCI|nr:STAS domain-containing protein [Amycolatopsis cihanbeyliensis]TQI94417.1 anti-anti-sigma factor [Amycolatopsis cihanbeyliensis]
MRTTTTPDVAETSAVAERVHRDEERQAIRLHGLHVDVERRGYDILLARLHGDIDIASAPGLRRCVDLVPEHGRGLVLDLDGVEFLGSAGISILVDLARNPPREDVRWAVAASGRAVLRPLEATGYLNLVPAYPTVDAAMAAVRSAGGTRHSG